MNKLVGVVLALTWVSLLEGCGDSPSPKRDGPRDTAPGTADMSPFPRDTGTTPDFPPAADQAMPQPDAGADRAPDVAPSDTPPPSDVRPPDTAPPTDVRPPDGAPPSDVRPPDAAVPGDVAVDMAPPGDTAPVDVAADVATPDVVVPVDMMVPVDVLTTDSILPDAASGEQVFVASLSGASENPSVTTTASGSVTVVLNAAKTEIRFSVRHNVVNPTAAHFHTASAGENGPVTIPITLTGTDTTGTAPVTPTVAADLEAGRLYANVHSMANPGGEIRGQVLRPGEVVYIARLSGTQEVPPVTTIASGHGTFIVNAARDALRYRVSIANISANAAHVHRAPGGVNGPIVFNLEPLGAGVVISGTTTLDAGRLADLERGLWYANVHSPTATAGEMRGQILREGETLYTAVMAGANEVPAVATAAKGGVALIVNYEGNAARYDGTVTDMTPTVAHIHTGAAGVNGGIVYPLTLMGTTLKGELTLTAADLTALNAGGYYANVHSALHMAGEIRGQLGKR